ncbi:myotubularin-related protein DDB_G0290005-like isoform X2 [Hyalella azteca]|uniref:Myotubularin-related protein DDB_G0290005-like isoform X2 n=1 Tax=Hyalella azteca TaxID=294128 RepID=A0A8B7NTX0_HYAAZ|nr:myotubularin-related protein DDB_G0290005-like isoform X2 [Hyalella azteca]
MTVLYSCWFFVMKNIVPTFVLIWLYLTTMVHAQENHLNMLVRTHTMNHLKYFQSPQVLRPESKIADGDKLPIIGPVSQSQVTFPPEIVRRTKEALEAIRSLALDIKNYIENPPTVPPASTPSPTPDPLNTTLNPIGTNGSVFSNATTTTPITTTTTPVTTTPAPPTSLDLVVTDGSVTTSTSETQPPTTTTTSTSMTTTPPETTKSTRRRLNIPRRTKNFGRSLSFDSKILARADKESSEELSSEEAYYAAEMIVSLQIAFNASERVMSDKLSEQLVVELELSVQKMNEMNKSLSNMNWDQQNDQVIFWLSYLLLSVKHSLQRMQYEQMVTELLSKTDDITIVITAAFCVLAVALAFGLFAYTFKSRKQNRGNYKIDRPSQSSNPRNIPVRNPSSSSTQPSSDPNSFFSVPSGVTVQTRSNPMYSSHRSVDVERPVTASSVDSYTISPTPKNRDSSGSLDDVPLRNEKNNRDRGAHFPASSTTARNFRDPSRNRDRKYDAAKDNEGFLDDDAVVVRKDSESAI